MARSRHRGKAIALLLVALFLISATNRLVARDDQDLGSIASEEIDKIVKGSPDQEKSKKDSDTPAKPPEVNTLPGGIKHETRSDGTEIFTRPDGTKQYVATDGTKVTIRQDGERILQKPNQDPVYLPPKVNDPDNYRPHSPPPSPPPSPTTPPPAQPLAEVTIPDPPDPEGRHHATWSDLAVGDHGDSSPTPANSPPTQSPRYNPPPPGTEDRLVMVGNQTYGKTVVYTYESGASQIVLPDGPPIASYPGIPEVSVRDTSGNVTTIKPDTDGLIRVPMNDTLVRVQSPGGRLGGDGLVRVPGGDTTATIDPASGRYYLEYGNGLRETVGRDGSWGVSDGKGGTEWRDADGRMIRSQIQDPATGYTVKLDRDGVALVFKDNQPVGIGTREPGGIKFRDKDGKELIISEIIDPTKYSATVTGQTMRAAGYNQPAAAANTSPPQPARIFDLVRPQLDRIRQEQGNLRTGSGGGPRGESDLMKFMRQVEEKQRAYEQIQRRLEALDKAARAVPPQKQGAKPKDDLDRVLKLAEDTVKKSDLERQVKQDEAQLASQKSALQEEKKRVDADKAQLALRETRAANMRKQASDDQFSLSIQRNGLIQLKIVADGADSSLKSREKVMKDAVAAALRQVDYSKYDRCPKKQPWKDCGGVNENGVDHNAIKAKWLNEQLARLLGPAKVAELKKLNQERKALDAQLKDLKDKDTELKKQEDAAKNLMKQATDDADALKKQRDQLTSRETQIQKQVDQAQSQVNRDRKQMADLDEAIKKYSPSNQ